MIQPSLQIGGGDWAVKETKLLGTNLVLNEKLPVEIDVTNATIATRVNKQGFIENGPKNLLLYSQSIGSGSWIFNSNTLPVINSTNSKDPNGGFTASYLTFNGQFAGCKQSVKVEIGKIYTISVWAKSDTNTNLLQFWAEASPQTSLGAFTPTNDWVRYQSTFVAYYTLQTPIAFAQDRNTSNFGSLWLWGAQFEEGPVATEYYPTITRTNLARIDYSSGEAALLIEPQRTNSLTNSELAGAATPSSLPTGFVINTNGLSFSVVEVGNEMGLKYVDIKLFGTAASSGSCGIRTSNTTSISASKNQNWSVSAYLKIVKEPLPPLGYFQNVYERNSGGSFLNSFATAFSNTTLQRITTNAFLTNVSTVFIQQDFIANLSAGENYDFTIRIAAPQMEQGSYATSYIPTLASAVTRNVDVISKNEISTLPTNYPFTMYAKGIFNIKNASLLSFSDTSSSTSVFSIGMDNNSNVYAVSRPNNNQSIAIGPVINLGQHSIAAVFTTTQIKLYLNGVLVNTSENVQPFKLEVKGIILGQFRIINDTGIRTSVNESLIFNSALSDKECIKLTTI